MLVVDDHEVVHWGLRLMLGEQPWVERCLSARNTQEALALARRYDPHVALVDLFVGQESGAEICQQLLALSPRLNVLLISGAGRICPNAAQAPPARRGFISKDWPAADIAGAVRMVGLGMTVFKPHEAPAGPPLSEREREVLEADRVRRHQPRDRRPALPQPAHRQGAHVLAVPQARRAQPRRSGAEGPASRPDLVTGGSSTPHQGGSAECEGVTVATSG